MYKTKLNKAIRNIIEWSLKNRPKWLNVSIFILNLIISIVIVYFAFRFVQNRNIVIFATKGYFSIFIATLLGSSTIFLPAPNIAVIMAGGIILNPIASGIIGGFGWAIGELVGYWVGRNFGEYIIKSEKMKKSYQKAEGFVKKWGLKAILVASAIPNPGFDAFGIAAGIYKIPVMRFIGACSVGKIFCAVVISLLSHYGFLGARI